MDEEPSFDLAAAGLRADAPDLAAGLESLARKLEEALPAETRVQRAPKRFLSRKKVVEAIEVRLGDSRYALRVDGGAVDAERHQEVRGVVIKRQELDLEAWLGELTAQLREHARTSERARVALERLLLG